MYVYVWYTDGTGNGEFPGQAATNEGGVYTYQTDATKTIAGVIIARVVDGTTYNQTGDLQADENHQVTVRNLNNVA